MLQNVAQSTLKAYLDLGFLRGMPGSPLLAPLGFLLRLLQRMLGFPLRNAWISSEVSAKNAWVSFEECLDLSDASARNAWVFFEECLGLLCALGD